MSGGRFEERKVADWCRQAALHLPAAPCPTGLEARVGAGCGGRGLGGGEGRRTGWGHGLGWTGPGNFRCVFQDGRGLESEVWLHWGGRSDGLVGVWQPASRSRKPASLTQIIKKNKLLWTLSRKASAAFC